MYVYQDFRGDSDMLSYDFRFFFHPEEILRIFERCAGKMKGTEKGEDQDSKL